MKKLIIFESILILFFVLAWNVSKAEEKIDFSDLFDDNKEKKSVFELLEEQNEIDEYNKKREVWIAECYLDVRKESEIVSDLDARLVNRHCKTLGYEKYPK